jgi:aminoglycoside 6'-N-acetyltransferase
VLTRAGLLTIRPLQNTTADLKNLARWLSNPQVLEYYEGRDHPFSLADVQEKYAPRLLAADGVQAELVLLSRQPVGYLQYERLEAETLQEYGLPLEKRIYGMDLFIGEPSLWGHGLGRQVVTLAGSWLCREAQAQIITLDPHVNNVRAIRCYTACGFRQTRRLPAHELHEGQWVDCWLMTKICEEPHESGVESTDRR